MFWGLIMEPGKKYSQVVEKDFHIAQAALDLDSALDSPVQVLISIDGRNYLVCTLIKNKICQANLDLNFRAGVKVSFATNGPGHVHLTGYLIPEDTEYDFEDSDEEVEEEETAKEEVVSKKRKAQQQKENKSIKKSKPAILLDQLDDENYNEDSDSDVNLTDLLDDSDDDSDDDEEEEAEHEEASDNDEDGDDSDEEESSEEEVKVVQKKSPQKNESPKQNGMTKKTPKHEKNQKLDKTPKGGDKTQKGGDKTQKGGDKTPKGGDKSSKEKTPKGPKTPMNQEKSPKNEQKQKTPKGNKSPGGDSNSPVKKVVEGGVFIEDLKVGEGRVAKAGNNVRVYYEGRFGTNNKLFDSSSKGPGFKFRLGKQEVIKGWDVGVAGMKIGGKRRIICPPHMAYGAGGSPPVIPPNATLVFDVELKHIQ